MITPWMDRASELSYGWLELVMLATWRTLPIFLLVIGIGLALRRKLTPSLRAMLLTIVLVRLLLPFSVGSSLSLHQPIDHWFGTVTPAEAGRSLPVVRDHLFQPLPRVARAETINEWAPNASNQTASVSTTAMRSVPTAWDEILITVLLAAVVLISAALMLRSLLSHLMFEIKLRSCPVLKDRALIDLVLRECDSLSVGRRPVLREVSSLAAPAVFGVFRQTICLPPGTIESLNEQELRWVIRHELAHLRRRDIPVTILASLAGALHWFNPVVWLIIRRLRSAMEAAADQLALQQTPPSQASAYGSLLLRFAESSAARRQSPTLGLISIASSAPLKQRVKQLMQEPKPRGPISRWLIAGLVAALAVVGLTDAKEAQPKMPELHLVGGYSIAKASALWNDPFIARDSDGPNFVQQYDVQSIFESMPESIASAHKTPQDQLAAWLPLSPALKGKWYPEEGTRIAELSARQHQLFQQILEKWKDGEPRQICIETRFIQTSITKASEIDWAARRIDGLVVRGVGPAIAARIPESELANLVRTASADPRSNIMFAPKVTMFDGQTAGIADQRQCPFVTGVDPKADGRMQPVVSLLDEGLRFVLTPNASDDETISLAFAVTASSIGKVSYANLPIKSPNDATPRFTVHVPATEQYEISSSVKLAKGESVVVAIPRVFDNEPGADAETTIIVALTPKMIVTQNNQ